MALRTISRDASTHSPLPSGTDASTSFHLPAMPLPSKSFPHDAAKADNRQSVRYDFLIRVVFLCIYTVPYVAVAGNARRKIYSNIFMEVYSSVVVGAACRSGPYTAGVAKTMCNQELYLCFCRRESDLCSAYKFTILNSFGYRLFTLLSIFFAKPSGMSS